MIFFSSGPSKVRLRRMPRGTYTMTPERREQIVTAVAAVKQGNTPTEAAKASGIPRETLYYWLKRVDQFTEQGGSLADLHQAAEEQLVGLSFANAIKAASKVNERLDSSDEWTNGELSHAYQTASNRVAQFRQWNRPSEKHSNDGSVLSKLAELGGGTVEVKLHDQSQEAIDVTPQEKPE